MRQNVIREKSFDFAVDTVKMFKNIQGKQHEFILTTQFLRSGTSIGANVREGLNAESKPDFIHKMSIAQKECDETIYWIELLYATEYVTKTEMIQMAFKAEELKKIIRSIILTTKHNMNMT